MARQLKEGDRLIDWDGDTGTVQDLKGERFTFSADHREDYYAVWVEFDPKKDLDSPEGTFRFADTEYPEFPW